MTHYFFSILNILTLYFLHILIILISLHKQNEIVDVLIEQIQNLLINGFLTPEQVVKIIYQNYNYTKNLKRLIKEKKIRIY